MNKYEGTSWDDLKKELLQDQETYKEYKALETEYEIINQESNPGTIRGSTSEADTRGKVDSIKWLSVDKKLVFHLFFTLAWVLSEMLAMPNVM